MADVGDRIEVSQTKGQPARVGLVIAIQGRMVSVRWDSGEESKLVPGPGAITVLGRGRLSSPALAGPASTPAPRAAAKATGRAKSAPRKAAKKAPAKRAPAKKAAKRAPAKRAPAKKAVKKAAKASKASRTRKAPAKKAVKKAAKASKKRR